MTHGLVDVHGNGIKYAASVQYLDLNGKGILKEFLVVPDGPKRFIETSKLPSHDIERIARDLKNA